MRDFSPQDFLARIEAAVPKAAAVADSGASAPVVAARDYYLKAVAEFDSAISGTKDTIAKLQADIDENNTVLTQYQHLRDAIQAAADLLTKRLTPTSVAPAAPQPAPAGYYASTTLVKPADLPLDPASVTTTQAPQPLPVAAFAS